MHSPKRVLIVSEANLIRTFVVAAAQKLREEKGVRYDCMITTKPTKEQIALLEDTFDHIYANDRPIGWLQHLPKVRFIQALAGMIRMAKKLDQYDIIHIYYQHYYNAYFAHILKKRTKKLFITFFGSDFNRISGYKHRHNQRTVNLADGIFATNEIFLNKILTRYNVSPQVKQTGILWPLMTNLDSLEPFLASNTVSTAKAAWNFDKGVIVCGYNASPINQHSYIFEALKKIAPKLSGYKIVLPMTYGWCADKMRNEVREQVQNAPYDWQILDTYLPTEKLQSLRLAADVFVSIPRSDQLSASMLEHLAAGSVVITGKWLMYDGLVEKGIYFISIEEPQDLADALTEVLNNLEEHKKKSKANREKILQMMRWNTIKKSWYTHYALGEQTSVPASSVLS